MCDTSGSRGGRRRRQRAARLFARPVRRLGQHIVGKLDRLAAVALGDPHPTLVDHRLPIDGRVLLVLRVGAVPAFGLRGLGGFLGGLLVDLGRFRRPLRCVRRLDRQHARGDDAGREQREQRAQAQ
jgi:hypothetical protein